MKKIIYSLILIFTCSTLFAQYVSKVWISDLGNGRYRNPVLYADYSEPDVCRVGNDYYMVSSSFSNVPGLPILQSKDLVNWKIIGYGLQKLKPEDMFSTPQHGFGIYSPSIRNNKGEFFIYYSNPELGIYMIKTTDPQKGWEAPVLVIEGKGLINPCPIWTEDGKAYLLYGFDGNRTGIKNVIALIPLKTDGKETIGEGVIVFDGHENHADLDGAKIVKKNGYYYIFASAGKAESISWLLTLRSKNILGPYEDKISMYQSKSSINGPYKGAFIDTPSGGESWFIHSQGIKNYGKVVCLSPIQWENEWPIIGGYNKSGTGEPILNYKKPALAQPTLETPAESDEFDGDQLGLQWQWNANRNPYWYFLDKNKKQLRLYSFPTAENEKNLWNIPNLLSQKLPYEAFTVTTKVKFTPSTQASGERCGLIITGMDYALLSFEKTDKGLFLSQKECLNANKGDAEVENQKVLINQNEIFLRVKMKKDFKCTFSYSLDGTVFYVLGKEFTTKENTFGGPKIGLFCTKPTKKNDAGWMDVDFFKFE